MPSPILYCGDTNLEGAASYLAGLMTHFGWHFDYVPSHIPMTRGLIERPHSLLILSDYPATQFDEELQQIALRQIEQGMGFLMIGGWESFHGFGGDWDVAPLARVLPVEISRYDDRANFDQPALLCLHHNRDELWGLPWLQRPPTIGGLNRFMAKPTADSLLIVQPFSTEFDEESSMWVWREADTSFPALVTQSLGSGRTAAFASDVAPHWVGGFVDWGPERVKSQAAGASVIEVGSYYAQFWKQLLSWVGRLE